jgi:hypothetical protein
MKILANLIFYDIFDGIRKGLLKRSGVLKNEV